MHSYDCRMTSDDASGHVWREHVHARVPLRSDAADLGRLIKHDHDEAETAYYELAADPDAQGIDDAQRSYAGQYRRRLRRMYEHRRHPRSAS